MTSRGLAALQMLVLVAALLGGSTAAGNADAGSAATRSKAATPAQTYQRQAIRTTNKQRVKRDRVALRKHACLQRKAASHAKRMAKQQRIFHQDLGKVLRDCGMGLVGENVASGYPTGVAVVNRGWMKSSSHRTNLLRPAFRRTGVAARKSGGTWYVSQVLGRG